MIKNFDKNDIQELLDTLQFIDGVKFSFAGYERTIFAHTDLANKIFNSEIEVKEISEKDYDDLFFAIKSVQETCICATNVEDPMLKKFLEALENDRKS